MARISLPSVDISIARKIAEKRSGGTASGTKCDKPAKVKGAGHGIDPEDRLGV